MPTIGNTPSVVMAEVQVTTMENQIEDMNGRLNSVNFKLNNKNFISRAPEAVVQNEKSKQEKYMSSLDKLNANLKTLE